MFLGSIVLYCTLPTGHCQYLLHESVLNLRIRCSCVNPVESMISIKNCSNVCSFTCRPALKSRSMPKSHSVLSTGSGSQPIRTPNASCSLFLLAFKSQVMLAAAPHLPFSSLFQVSIHEINQQSNREDNISRVDQILQCVLHLAQFSMRVKIMEGRIGRMARKTPLSFERPMAVLL